MYTIVQSSILGSRRGPRVFTILVGIGLFLGVLGAPVQGQDTGTGAFSRLGFGARGVALGNALVADPSDDVSPYYNPALLPSASGQRLAASAALLTFDRKLQFLEFATPVGPSAGVGVNLIHAGVDDIDGRNRDGEHTRTLSTDEFAVSLSFGNRFAERLSVGTTLTLYQSDLVPRLDPVRGLGVTVGVGVQITERWHLAGTVHDLLARYEWDTSAFGGRSHTDRFPVRARVGASYVLLNERLRLLAEVESRYTARDRRRPGVRITSRGPQPRMRTESFLFHDLRGRMGASYRPIDVLALRAGLDRLGVDDLGGLRPSVGFGLRHTIGTLDVRVSYTVALEPYVRDAMHLGTLEMFL